MPKRNFPDPDFGGLDRSFRVALVRQSLSASDL